MRDRSTPELDSAELLALVRRVFAPRPGDHWLAILTDLPDAARPDHPQWRERRALAVEWLQRLATAPAELGIEAHLFFYRNVRSNNADLPARVWRYRGGPPPLDADACVADDELPLAEVLARYSLVIAATELSATAPLKMAAPRYGFRAATMPGFSRAMIAALRLDYEEVNRRVVALARLLDEHDGADVLFAVAGERHALHLDLRHRSGHASGGLLREPGTAGNLPSGEAYIVPYEGEHTGDPSRSAGTLPVQHGDEVVLYRIVENRAVEVLGEGERSRQEAVRLAEEPAYGNLAELGLGVLADLGVEPIGVVLLDEKLGLHIAFGRSDHFGGQVGPGDFRNPEAVVHIDHVYLPQLQPRITVLSVELVGRDGGRLPLIEDGRYVIAF